MLKEHCKQGFVFTSLDTRYFRTPTSIGVEIYYRKKKDQGAAVDAGAANAVDAGAAAANNA